jgi:predicted NAD/FAD-dependent oxidoreductase
MAGVQEQARQQLGLDRLELVQTVIERRATFACTPGLQRPPMQVLPGDGRVLACGDYVQGPYPATLEGAVRSGLTAGLALGRQAEQSKPPLTV